MQETWRYFFYYALGLAPSLFFGLRFLVQWIDSEKRHKSHVSKLFWYLSFGGNALSALHYFIQLQYVLMILQVVNGFISWRNINLLDGGKKRSFKFALFMLGGSALISSALFFAQFLLSALPLKLFEVPFSLINKGGSEISLLWHLFGAFGCLLFASRFWIQWLEAEKSGASQLNKKFWVLSIVGSSAALIYFVHIHDWVSSLSYSFGLIPYIRNLMLGTTLKSAKSASPQEGR